MSDTPRLETGRLVLRPVRIDDAPAIFEYARDPAVLQYTTGVTPEALAETESFVRGLVDKPPGAHAWAICLKPSPEAVGVVEYGSTDGIEGSVDYALARAHWNQGLMTEVVRAVLDWAFAAHPRLERVASSAMAANPASTRVQEKCGMRPVRRESVVWPKFGHPVELVVSAVTRVEWAAGWSAGGPQAGP